MEVQVCDDVTSCCDYTGQHSFSSLFTPECYSTLEFVLAYFHVNIPSPCSYPKRPSMTQCSSLCHCVILGEASEGDPSPHLGTEPFLSLADHGPAGGVAADPGQRRAGDPEPGAGPLRILAALWALYHRCFCPSLLMLHRAEKSVLPLIHSHLCLAVSILITTTLDRTGPFLVDCQKVQSNKVDV